jgi:hypothetical protein
MNAPNQDRFHKLIHENHMYGLWEIASQMTPQPQPAILPGGNGRRWGSREVGTAGLATSARCNFQPGPNAPGRRPTR